MKSSNVTRNKKEQNLKNIQNIPQLKRIYSAIADGKRPEPALANTRESLISLILSKVKSKPSNSRLQWGTKGKRSKRQSVRLPTLLEENEKNIITLPDLLNTKKSKSYKYVTIPPDGDCFYNAVIRDLKLKVTAREFRNELAKTVKNKRVLRRIKAPFGTGESWAENEEIQATANMLGVCFMIFMQPSDTWMVIYPDPQPQNASFGTGECKKVVHLYNVGSRATSNFATESNAYHFNLLIPR